jgi:hypothetical protein
MHRSFVVFLCFGATVVATCAAYEPAPIASDDHAARPQARPSDELPASEVFERRILPILRSDKASSCTECHFGGVELKNYIHDDQAATFAALRADGLIDVKAPDDSKLLEFISRHSEKTDPLMARVRENEYRAFRTWIHAAVRDPTLLAAKATDARVGSELSPDVIRHLRRDRVLAAFTENIWSEIGRCLHCHSPEKNQKFVEKHGEQMSWIRPGDPAGTLAQAVEQGIIDTESPEESLILLKPLVLVEHGGGPKFIAGSRTDKNFRRFLIDYAAVVKQRYQRKEQLPASPSHVTAPTGQHLRILNLPAGFDRNLLRADIYRWTGDRWSEAPVAMADGPINGERRMWQSMVFRITSREKQAGDAEGPSEQQLPSGRYLIRIYLDEQDKAKQNRDYELGKDEFFAAIETDGPWPPGYQPPKIVEVRSISTPTQQ